jgi:CheY-like chemotaxis protein
LPDQDKTPGRHSRRETRTRAPCDKSRLLLVDDEESIRFLFHMILCEELPQLDIDLAENGEAALNIFREKHHALLVMDLHMPVMDGRAAFEAIRETCEIRGWEVPCFVFCTGFVPSDDITKAVQGDNRHCLLTKPVTAEVLAETVSSRLA